MIRIAHVISDLDTGGAEMMLAKLVGAMDRTRFSNTVISLTDRGQLGEQIELSGVAVHTLGMTRGRPDLLPCLDCSACLRRFARPSCRVGSIMPIS